MPFRNLPRTILLSPLVFIAALAEEKRPDSSVFAKDNLVAWCIVPFDAKKRAPAERAEMLKRLGIGKVAYDWRKEHVPSFEEEILQYKKHGLEYFAFWGWHDSMDSLIEKHGIKPQIWTTNASPVRGTREEKIETAARAVLPLVEKTRKLRLELGLYNHGGWGGEPANLVAVCEYLRKEHGARHVGIVYNLHHGHGHIRDFTQSLERMLPYLLCLNLNGMVELEGPPEQLRKNKILPIGAGTDEQKMTATIRDSGYAGPIGILDHRDELDAEESLRQNLEGLEKILRKQGDHAALKTFR